MLVRNQECNTSDDDKMLLSTKSSWIEYLCVWLTFGTKE